MTHWPPLPDPFPPMPERSFTRLPSATAALEEVKRWARDNFVSETMSEREATAMIISHVRYWRDWVRYGQ